MNLFVPLALIPDVALDDLLIGILSHGVHVEAACPEMSSPENFLDIKKDARSAALLRWSASS